MCDEEYDLFIRLHKKIKNRLYLQENYRWWDNSHWKVIKRYLVRFTELGAPQALEKTIILNYQKMPSTADVMHDTQ